MATKSRYPTTIKIFIQAYPPSQRKRLERYILTIFKSSASDENSKIAEKIEYHVDTICAILALSAACLDFYSNPKNVELKKLYYTCGEWLEKQMKKTNHLVIKILGRALERTISLIEALPHS